MARQSKSFLLIFTKLKNGPFGEPVYYDEWNKCAQPAPDSRQTRAQHAPDPGLNKIVNGNFVSTWSTLPCAQIYHNVESFHTASRFRYINYTKQRVGRGLLIKLERRHKEGTCRSLSER